MTKTIGFTTYETISVSNINPRAAGRLDLESRHPYVIPPRPSPLDELSVSARRYPFGSIEVLWEIGTASGGLGSYLGGRPSPWRFPSLPSSSCEGAALWELLRDAAILEKAGPRPDGPQDAPARDRLFWKQFVRDVEDIWPVAEVMFR